MRTTPFPEDLFQDIHPNHQVLLSYKPHRPGCHQWRPAQTTLAAQIRELQPNVIVECYLDAKYYHYEPGQAILGKHSPTPGNCPSPHPAQ